MIPAAILSWFYAYFSYTGSDGGTITFYQLTLDASLVIAVMFFGTAIAATILPWWKPELYDKSPIARYKVVGLPLISIAGLVTTLFLGWVIAEWLQNTLYGIGVGNTPSMVFLAALYGLAALVYVIARFVRRAQGVDLDAIHAEIPAE
jgi:hypothetical protein